MPCEGLRSSPQLRAMSIMPLVVSVHENIIMHMFVEKDWIDEWGGWWLYRWGDAAIRGVQAWIMLEAWGLVHIVPHLLLRK